ncbi:hypothetical protein OROMI_009695 [Orobanche minor]
MRGECKYFASVFASVHQVYELPDDHPILDEVDRRDLDDPSPYLFAVWNEGVNIEVLYPILHPQESKSAIKLYATVLNLIVSHLFVEHNTSGTFPLNGTYFQVNEEKRVSTILYTPLYNNARDKVFADDESTQSPIVVPRNWLSDSTRKNRYCGTSPTTIFKVDFVVTEVSTEKQGILLLSGTGSTLILCSRRKKLRAAHSNTHAF